MKLDAWKMWMNYLEHVVIMENGQMVNRREFATSGIYRITVAVASFEW